MKEIRVNKYIKNQCKQIHAYKVIGRRRQEKKHHKVGIYYELFDIYTIYIEEVDMNKKSNVSLICGSMNYKKRKYEQNIISIYIFFFLKI